MDRSRLLPLPVLLLMGCGDMPGVKEQSENRSVPSEVKKHLDEETVAVLAGATKVEAFRLEGAGPVNAGTQSQRQFGGFAVKAQGKDQGQAFAKKLADVLLDEETYSTTFAACFTPGVAFRVWKGEACVDVVVCFLCQNFYCGPPTGNAREIASFADTPARATLVRLAKEAFPDDKEVQSLEEK
jgi:hypothetical protein